MRLSWYLEGSVWPSSFHLLIAMTALRFGYTRLRSLRPSVSPPPPPPPLELAVEVFLRAASEEKWRATARYLPMERSDIWVLLKSQVNRA